MSIQRNDFSDRSARSCPRLYVVDQLWPSGIDQKLSKSSLDWGPYLEYYHDQWTEAMYEQGSHIAVKKHQHIIAIARRLHEGCSRTALRADVKERLNTTTHEPDEEELLDNSIDLAARLILMVNVGTHHKSTIRQGMKLWWNDRNPREFLQDTFPKSCGTGGTPVHFEKDFTALNMERIADITICWTNNLADHLRMVEDDRVVAIFHHATFLKRQQSNALFPKGLIDETIRTLALLFPRDDKQGLKWLHKARSSFGIDGHLMHCDRLRLEDRQIKKFEFWNDRLVILKQAFDESRPVTMKQWWYDRRDGHTWYTFWIALFVLFTTIFFGVVQSVESALQVYKAYHPSI